MISAGAFALLLFHPASPVAAALPSEWTRRLRMGLAMGGTAVALIYSPWGQRSGAHYNPAVTLTFLRLGKVTPRDAAFYMAAQTVGGIAGLQLLALCTRGALGHPTVDYVATVPGPAGAGVALLAEMAISFLLMTVVLTVSSRPGWARWTGVCAGGCVALFILVEAPISGMSLNPARTLASAVAAGHWESLWVYAAGPPIGMLLAAAWLTRRRIHPGCAKMHHTGRYRCLFCEPR
jgi:aquaporin Z